MPIDTPARDQPAPTRLDASDAASGLHAGTPLAVARVFVCQCGRPVFFRNTRCVACGTPLGYDPEIAQVLPLQPGPEPDSWRRFGSDHGEVYARCANFDAAAACNWLVRGRFDDPPAPPLCRNCRLNRTIPDVSFADNGELWARVEVAKRRLVSALIGLGLPVRSRVGEDPVAGLAFDLLRPIAGAAPIVTGHADGIVTLNIEEADDATRESTRVALQEPYRTLLGHLRHEVGHYYWQRLVRDSEWLEPFREVFGDERTDYAAALAQHYRDGPRADWRGLHVSAYASSHPWEDWAETWAHYLHMVDTLDTASSFGLDAHASDLHYEPFTRDALFRPQARGADRFLRFVNAWVELSGVLNELSRSMGQSDLYPFVLSAQAVAKLQFVHLVAGEPGGAAATRSAGAPPPELPRDR